MDIFSEVAEDKIDNLFDFLSSQMYDVVFLLSSFCTCRRESLTLSLECVRSPGLRVQRTRSWEWLASLMLVCYNNVYALC